MHIQSIRTVLIAKGLHARSQGNRPVYTSIWDLLVKSKTDRTGDIRSGAPLGNLGARMGTNNNMRN